MSLANLLNQANDDQTKPLGAWRRRVSAIITALLPQGRNSSVQNSTFLTPDNTPVSDPATTGIEFNLPTNGEGATVIVDWTVVKSDGSQVGGGTITGTARNAAGTVTVASATIGASNSSGALAGAGDVQLVVSGTKVRVQVTGPNAPAQWRLKATMQTALVAL